MKNRIAHYLMVTLHKFYVARGLFNLASGLMWRALTHDLSKFGAAEASTFSDHIPMLAVTPYGSRRYREILKKMKKALDAHYQSNRHHPEHWKYGIHEMDAVDLCEMLCDWAAASRNSPGGDLLKSVEHNQERFHTGSVMADVFRNTALFRWGPESRRRKNVLNWAVGALTAASTGYLLWGWLCL
jgi:hypothetical protein